MQIADQRRAAPGGNLRRLLGVANEARHLVSRRARTRRAPPSRCTRSRRSGRYAWPSHCSPAGLTSEAHAARETLVDFFAGPRREAPGEFLVYDDGFRTRRYSYGEVAAAARGFAGRLHEAGPRARATRSCSGPRTGPSGSPRSGAASSRGVVVVPIDYRSSPDFARRVGGIVARARRAGRRRRRRRRRPTAQADWRRHRRVAAVGVSTGADGRRAAPGRPAGGATTWPRSSSRPARRPSPRASSSRTATCWPTSSRSSARC